MDKNINMLASIIPDGELSTQDFRDWIVEIENKMKCVDGCLDRHSENSPIGLGHSFTPGLYSREIFMPAGSLIISRIHLWEHPYVISCGRVSVYDGVDIVEISAPYHGITKAGTKRILYVHEDTTWTTFHITDKTTFEEIDADGVITCDTFKDFEQIVNKEVNLCLG
jgi:hypothetical protein